jgi:hypothetical protein
MHQMYLGETKMNFDDYIKVVDDTRTKLGTIKQSFSDIRVRVRVRGLL